jgi:hypothetical protein
MRRALGAAFGTSVGVALVVGALPGCAVYSNSPGKTDHGATSLRGEKIPADFMFLVTRPLDVTVAVDPSLLHGQDRAGVQIANAAGHLLFEGSLTASAPLKLRIPVPTKDQSLKVTLRTQGAAKTEEVAILQGAASHTFQ